MSDSTPKILFVDDEDSILKGVKLNLGRTYDILTAPSGRDALKLIEEEKEPFQVIVSDFAMPGMNGADFLEKVRAQDKEVVTILLTGQANFDDLCEVVRRGEIFRLLGKPCPPEVLSKNLEQALRQYHLIRSEKDLLEKTLNGTISAMSTLLSAAMPLFHGRAERVKQLALETSRELNMPSEWRLQVAANFCYLGHLTLPDEAQEKVYFGENIPPSLSELVDGLPQFVSEILGGIPRLNKVRKIIEYIPADYVGETDEDEVRKLASIIRISQVYDQMESAGCSKSEIFEKLRQQESSFAPGVLDALAHSRVLSGGVIDPKTIQLNELRPGMRLLEDIRVDGKLLGSAGSMVSLSLVQTIRSYIASGGDSAENLPRNVEVLV
jgi:CheY-like chemotaxis protein